MEDAQWEVLILAVKRNTSSFLLANCTLIKGKKKHGLHLHAPSKEGIILRLCSAVFNIT